MALPIISLLASGNANTSVALQGIPWSGYTACYDGSALVVYTLDSVPALGNFIYLYTDIALTTPLANTTFQRSNILYTTDSGGQIIDSTGCYTRFIGTTSCDNAAAKTVYLAYGGSLGYGAILFLDSSLTTLMTSSTFKYGGNTYTTNGSGVVTSIFTCLLPFTAYTDCAHSNVIGTKYCTGGGGTLAYGVYVYNNSSGTTLYHTTSFYANNYRYDISSTSGMIDGEYICFESFVTYTNCEGTDSPTTYYTSFGSSLIVGTQLYTDSGLTTLLNVAISFAKDGVTYRTTSAGIIDLVYNCYTSYVIEQSCNNNTPTTVYAQPPTVPTDVGTTARLYSDGMGMYEITSRYYKYGPYLYYYNNGYGIQYDSVCST
jgi:hypothetical protein